MISRSTLFDGKPRVQLSLDLEDLDEALATAEVGVRAGVDWLEVGTPLILAEGLRAVRALREKFPDRPIIADLKTMDGGYQEAEMMIRAGATFVVVMAVAHEYTIRRVVEAARTFEGYVMGDIMLHADKPGIAEKMEAWGVDVIVVHTGFDERHMEKGKSPLPDVEAVRHAVKIPLQAVGGLSLDQAARLPGLGAPLVVIGAPLAIDDEVFRPGAGGEKLFGVIRDFVGRVKGGA